VPCNGSLVLTVHRSELHNTTPSPAPNNICSSSDRPSCLCAPVSDRPLHTKWQISFQPPSGKISGSDADATRYRKASPPTACAQYSWHNTSNQCEPFYPFCIWLRMFTNNVARCMWGGTSSRKTLEDLQSFVNASCKHVLKREASKRGSQDFPEILPKVAGVIRVEFRTSRVTILTVLLCTSWSRFTLESYLFIYWSFWSGRV
jgi:hypothetical protein